MPDTAIDLGWIVVLLQRDIYGCRVSVVFRSKVQCAGNGMPLPRIATQSMDADKLTEPVTITLKEH